MMRLCSILPILPILLASHRATAQSAGAQAQAVFDNGRKLVAQDRYAEACPLFEAALKLDPTTNTVIVLADCREKNSELASARGLYLRAERELRSFTDVARVKLRETVSARAASLEGRLSNLTIRVFAENRPPGLEVLRDDDRLDPALWNQALPIDGGTYRISARAPYRREWTTTVHVRPEGDRQVVDVPMLVTEPVTPHPVKLAPRIEPQAAPASELPMRTASTAADTERRRDLRLPIAIAAGVLGVTAIGVELWGRSIYTDAEAAPSAADQDRLWRAANTRRGTAIALGIGSLACAGTAVALHLFLRTPHKFAPAVSRDGVGATWTMRW
jgi:hypothetical protein